MLRRAINCELRDAMFAILKHGYSRSLKRKWVRGQLSQFVYLGVKVLDYGAGAGPFQNVVVSSGGEYCSADHAPTAVRYGPGSDLLIDYDGCIDSEPACFDVALCTEVLEHTANPVLALKEIARLLREGGVVVGTTPFAVPIHDAPHDYNRLTEYGLRDALEIAGFEDVCVRPFGSSAGAVWILIVGLLWPVRRLLHRSVPRSCGSLVNALLNGLEIPALILNRLVGHQWSGAPRFPSGYGFSARVACVSPAD